MFQSFLVRWSQVFVLWFICHMVIQNLKLTSAERLVVPTDSLNPDNTGDTQDYPGVAESNAEISLVDTKDFPEASQAEEKSLRFDYEMMSPAKKRPQDLSIRNKPEANSTSFNGSFSSAPVNIADKSVPATMGKKKPHFDGRRKNTKSSSSLLRKQKRKRIISFERKKSFPEFPLICNRCSSENLSIVPICSKKLSRKQDLSSPEKIVKKAHVHIGNVSTCHLNVHSSPRNNSCEEYESKDNEREDCVQKHEKNEMTCKAFKHLKSSTAFGSKIAKTESPSSSVSCITVSTSLTSKSLTSNGSQTTGSALVFPFSTTITVSEVSMQPEEQPKKCLLPILSGSQSKHRSTSEAYDQSNFTASTSIKSLSSRNPTNGSRKKLKFVSTTPIFQNLSEKFESTVDRLSNRKPDEMISSSEKQIENQLVNFDLGSTPESSDKSSFDDYDVQVTSSTFEFKDLNHESAHFSGETLTTPSVIIAAAENSVNNTNSSVSNLISNFNESSTSISLFELLDSIQKEGQLLIDLRNTSKIPGIDFIPFNKTLRVNHSSLANISFSLLEESGGQVTPQSYTPAPMPVPHGMQNFDKMPSNCSKPSNFSRMSIHHNPLNRSHNIPLSSLLDLNVKPHETCKFWKFGSHCKCMQDLLDKKEDVHPELSDRKESPNFKENFDFTSIDNVHEMNKLNETNKTCSCDHGSKSIIDANEIDSLKATGVKHVSIRNETETDNATTKTHGMAKSAEFFKVPSSDKVEQGKNKTFNSIEIKKPNGTFIPIFSPEEITRSIKSSPVFDSVETINDAEKVCLEKLKLLQAIKKLIVNDSCLNDWPLNNSSKPLKLENSSISEPILVVNSSNKRVSDNENIINSTHELIDNTENVFTLVTKLPFLISNALSKNFETFSKLYSNDQISESPIPNKVDKFALKIFMDGCEIYNDMVSRDFFHSIRLNQSPESSNRNDFVAVNETVGIPKLKSSLKPNSQDKEKFFPLKMSLSISNGVMKDKGSEGIFHKVKNNVFTFGKAKVKSVKDAKMSEPASSFLDHFSENESKLHKRGPMNEAEPPNFFRTRNLQCDYDYDTALNKNIDFKDYDKRMMSAQSVTKVDTNIPILSIQNDMERFSDGDGAELLLLEMKANNSLPLTANESVISSLDQKSTNHQLSPVNLNSITIPADEQSPLRNFTITSGRDSLTNFSDLNKALGLNNSDLNCQTHAKIHKENTNGFFLPSNVYPANLILSRPPFTEFLSNSSDLAEVSGSIKNHLNVNSSKSSFVTNCPKLGKKQSRIVFSKIFDSDLCSKNVSSNDFLEMLSNTFGNSSNSYASNLKQNGFSDVDGSLIHKRLSPSKTGGGEYFSLFLSNMTGVPVNQNLNAACDPNSNITLTSTRHDNVALAPTTSSFTNYSNIFDASTKSNCTRNKIFDEVSCAQKNLTYSNEFFLTPLNKTATYNKVFTNPRGTDLAPGSTNPLKNSSSSQSILSGILTNSDRTSPFQVQVAAVTESGISNSSTHSSGVNVSKTSEYPTDNLSPTKVSNFSSLELHKHFFSLVSPSVVLDSKLPNTSKVETFASSVRNGSSKWLNALLPKEGATVIGFNRHIPLIGNTSSAALTRNVSAFASNFFINDTKNTTSINFSVAPTISVMAGQNGFSVKGNLLNSTSVAPDLLHILVSSTQRSNQVSAKNSPSPNLRTNENLDAEGTQNSSIVFIQNTTILKIPVFLASMGNVSNGKSNFLNFSISSIAVSPELLNGTLSNTSVANAFYNFMITENLALQKLQKPSFFKIRNGYNVMDCSTPRLNVTSQKYSNFSEAFNVVIADGPPVNEAVSLRLNKEMINDPRNTPAPIYSENMSYPLKAYTGLSSFTNIALYRKKKVYPKFNADVKNKIQFLTPMILLNRSVTLEPNSGSDLKIPVEGKSYEEKTLPSNISTLNNSEHSFIPSAPTVMLPVTRITIENSTVSNCAFFPQISKKPDLVENPHQDKNRLKSNNLEQKSEELAMKQITSSGNKCFLSVFVFNDTKGNEYHVMKYNNKSNGLNFDNCLVLKQKSAYSYRNLLSSPANSTSFDLSSVKSNCSKISPIVIQPDSSLSPSILEDKQGLSQFTDEFNKITANQESQSKPFHSNDQHHFSSQPKNSTHFALIDSQLPMNESRNVLKKSQVSVSQPVSNSTCQVFKFLAINTTLSLHKSSYSGRVDPLILPTVSSAASNSSSPSADLLIADSCSERRVKPNTGSRNLPSFPEINKGEISRKNFDQKLSNNSEGGIVTSHLSAEKMFTTPPLTSSSLTKPVALNNESKLSALEALINRTINFPAVSSCDFDFLDLNATYKPPGQHRYPTSFTKIPYSLQTLVTVQEIKEQSPWLTNSDILKKKCPKIFYFNSSCHQHSGEENNQNARNFSSSVNQTQYVDDSSSNVFETGLSPIERIQKNISVHKPATIMMATDGDFKKSYASDFKSEISLSQLAKSKLHNTDGVSGVVYGIPEYYNSSPTTLSVYQTSKINLNEPERALNQMVQNNQMGSGLAPAMFQSSTFFPEPPAAFNAGRLEFNVFTTELPPSFGQPTADWLARNYAVLNQAAGISSQTCTAVQPYTPEIFLGHGLLITNAGNASLRPLGRHNSLVNHPSFNIPQMNHIFENSHQNLRPFSPAFEVSRNEMVVNKEMPVNQIYLPMNEFSLGIRTPSSNNMNSLNFPSASSNNVIFNYHQSPSLQKSSFKLSPENVGPEITTVDYFGFGSKDPKLDSSSKYRFLVEIPSKFPSNIEFLSTDQSRTFFSSTQGGHFNNMINTSPLPISQSSPEYLPVEPVAARTNETNIILSFVKRPPSTLGETKLTAGHQCLNLIHPNEMTFNSPNPTFFNQPLYTPGCHEATPVFLVINNYNQPYTSCTSDQKLVDFKKKLTNLPSGGPVAAKLRILAKPDVFLSFLKRHRICPCPLSEEKNLPESVPKTTCFCNAAKNHFKNRNFCSGKRSNSHKRISYQENSATVSTEPKSSETEFSFTSSSGLRTGSLLVLNFSKMTNHSTANPILLNRSFFLNGSENRLIPANNFVPVNHSVVSHGAAHVNGFYQALDDIQNNSFVPLNYFDVGGNISSNDVSFFNLSNSSTEISIPTSSSKMKHLGVIKNLDLFSSAASSVYPDDTFKDHRTTQINFLSINKVSNSNKSARLNGLPSGTLEFIRANAQSTVGNFSRKKTDDINVDYQFMQSPILIFGPFSKSFGRNLSTLADIPSRKVFKVYGNKNYGSLEPSKFSSSFSKPGSFGSDESKKFGLIETTAQPSAYSSTVTESFATNKIPSKIYLPSLSTPNPFLQKAQMAGNFELKNNVATKESEHLHFEQPKIRQGLHRKSCNRPHFRGQIPCTHQGSHRFHSLRSRHGSRMSSGKSFVAPRKSFDSIDLSLKNKQLKADHLSQADGSRNLKTKEDSWTNPASKGGIGTEPNTSSSRPISSHDQQEHAILASKADSSVTEYLGDSILLFEDNSQSRGKYFKSLSSIYDSGLKKESDNEATDPTFVENSSMDSPVNFEVTANFNFQSEKLVQQATNKPLILKIFIQNITEDASDSRIKNHGKFKGHQGSKGNFRKIHSRMHMSSHLSDDSKEVAAFNVRPDRSVIKMSERWRNDSLGKNNTVQPTLPGNPFNLLFAGQQKSVEVSNDAIAELPAVMKKLLSLNEKAAPLIQVGKREERQSNMNQIRSIEVDPLSKNVHNLPPPIFRRSKPSLAYLSRRLKSYHLIGNHENPLSKDDLDFESSLNVNELNGGIGNLFGSDNKIQISRKPETSSFTSMNEIHEKKPYEKTLTDEQSISNFNRNASEIFNRAFENNTSNLLLMKRELDHFSKLLLTILKECPTNLIKGSCGRFGAEKLEQEQQTFSNPRFFSILSSTLRPFSEPVKNYGVSTSYPFITPFARSLKIAKNVVPVAPNVVNSQASNKEVSNLLPSEMKLPGFVTGLTMDCNNLGIASTSASTRRVFSACTTNYQASGVDLESSATSEFGIPMNRFAKVTSQPSSLTKTKGSARHEMSTKAIVVEHSHPISHDFPNVSLDQSLEWFIPSDQNLKRNKHLILKWVQKLLENSSTTESGVQFDLPAKDCKRTYNTNCVCDMSKALSNYDEIICDKTYTEEKKLHKILDYQCSSYLPLPLGYNINSESKPRILTSKKKQMVSDNSSGPKEIDVEGLNYLLHIKVTPPGASFFHNAFAGSKISIPCYDNAKVALSTGSAEGTKYKWRKGNKIITDGRVKETPEGVLIVENVALNDAGQYLCTVLFVNPESSGQQQRIFNHTLGVVTIPKIAIQALVHYKANTECTPTILEMFDLYLPQQIQESICDYGEEDSDICSLDVYNPLCFKNSTDSMIISLNVQMDVKGIDYLLVGGANKSVCSPMCHQKLYLKTSLILKESLHEALLTNVPCPPHTYSKEGSTQCLKCPFNFYQPQLGSRACIQCPFPLAPGCNTISRKAASSFMKLVANLLMLLLFVTVAYFFTILIIKNFRHRKKGKIFSRNIISKKILGKKDGKAEQKPTSKKKKSEDIELRELLPLRHYDSDHSTDLAETEFGASTTERTRSGGSISSVRELNRKNLDFLILKPAKLPEKRGRPLPKILSPVRRKYPLQDNNDKPRVTNERSRAPYISRTVQKMEKSVQTPKRKKKPPLPKPDFT